MRAVTLLLLIACLHVHARPWQEVKNEQGIAIYQQPLKSGLVKLKAVTTTQGCIKGFKALLFDTEKANQWLTNVRSVKVLDAPSEHEHLIYTQFNVPWPIKNRDMVTYSRTFRVSKTQLQIAIQAAPNVYPKQKNYVRIDDVFASWVINQLSENSMSIEYQAIADPAGKIPRWLSNSVTTSNAYRTFEKMKEQLVNYPCR